MDVAVTKRPPKNDDLGAWFRLLPGFSNRLELTRHLKSQYLPLDGKMEGVSQGYQSRKQENFTNGQEMAKKCNILPLMFFKDPF